MSPAITYAKVDGPPEDWCGLRVIDLQTGSEVRDVIEASTLFTCGWVRKLALGADGEPYLNEAKDAIVEEVIYGRFEIRRPS